MTDAVTQKDRQSGLMVEPVQVHKAGGVVKYAPSMLGYDGDRN